MTESPERFADLLTHAIRRIKRVENNKPIRVIQDELGYALGRDGGSAVEYWRKGNLPPGRQDVEELARLLVRRGRLDQAWLKEFLESGGCGLSAATLAAQLFGDGTPTVVVQPPDEAPSTPAPAAAPPFQTPGVTTHFVGRELELTRIQQLLTAAVPPRVVALVGMGGAGKTTLAAQAAHQLREQYGDGVLWAHTQVSSPLDILNSWARAFGYDYSGLRDVESCAAALRSALAAKQLLFVLDDITSAAQVRSLFVGGQAAAFLLTTRSEDVAAALNSQLLHLAELAPAEGVQLLVSLLGDARVAAEEAAAAQICALVHHLPLAVEIAGQLLVARPRRSLAQMAKRLQDVQYRLDLQISDRDVRTSFWVSWEALDATHQRVFAHLALFGGRSFTAAAVANVLAEDEEDVIDQLDLLVARSLLTAVADDRYRQHPLLADFAQEQLGDAREPWSRFAHCQLDFARHHQTGYAALEPEWDNLMAGMVTAHQLQEWRLVLDYAEVLTEPWFTRAEYTRARQGYAWAMAAAEALGEQQALLDCLYQWGQACLEQNAYDAAADLLSKCTQVARTLGNLVRLGAATYLLARLARQQGCYALAEQYLNESYAIRTSLGDALGIAETWYGRAHLAYQQGDSSLAALLRTQVLEVQQTNGDKLGALRTLRLLSLITSENKQYAAAEAHNLQALALAHELGDRGELASARYALAIVYRRQEKLEQALQYAQESAHCFEHMGDRLSWALALYELSVIQEKLETYEDAVANGFRSQQLLDELQDTYASIYVLLHLGDLYVRMEQTGQAQEYWQTAWRLSVDHHHPLQAQLEKRLQHTTAVPYLAAG